MHFVCEKYLVGSCKQFNNSVRVPPLVSKKDYQRAQNVFSNIYIAIRFGISSLKKNIRHQNKRPTSFLGILREYHGTNSQDISYMLIINEPNI